MSISPFDRAHIGDILVGHGDWFTADLLRLIAHADGKNRAKLRAVFPDEVQAYLDWCHGTADGNGDTA